MTGKKEKEVEMKFIITNCRAVKNKTESLEKYMSDADASFAVISETWMNEENTDRIINDLKNGYNLRIIFKNRKDKKGGGVAIVWRDSKVKFSNYRMESGVMEIAVARAELKTEKRVMFVFSVYYPPSMMVDHVEKMNEAITDEIQKIKTRENDPIVIIAGDTNLKNCDAFADEFPDLIHIVTPPTRADNCLDNCYSNVHNMEPKILPPLTSSYGSMSDHKTLLMSFKIKIKEHVYRKVLRRKITKKGEDNFVTALETCDWSPVYNADSSDEKTEMFHAIIERLKDEYFPLKMSKIRDDEDPWITDYLRKLLNKKKKEFGKNGKSERYERLCGIAEQRTSEAKNAYYDREVEKIHGGNRNIAYAALKNLKSAERPKGWSLSELDPEKPIDEVMEEAADFFSSISNGNMPVDVEKIKWTYDRPIFALTPDMIEKRIKESKKPSSQVPGDIPPKLLNRVANAVSFPVANIYNNVPKTMEWPKQWRKEYQTMIPKTPNPTNMNEIRNLSCTNFLSKVMESFVIDGLKTEIEFSELQYGGLKGTGTDNFLCEAWNNILETLDNPEKSTALMSVDFSKAFNRLSHNACLEKLAAKNASNQSLALIYSFLQGRTMVVRSDGKVSSPRPVTGGSPQGTKLGNLLFCISIDDIVHQSETETNLESPISAVPAEYRNPQMITSTPIRTGQHDDSFNPNPFGFRQKKNIIRDSILEDPLDCCEYENTETWEIGYIDDINIGEELLVDQGIRHITTGKEKRILRAKGCEEKFMIIEKNGTDIGLKINPAKTQLICFHNNTYDIKAQVNINGKLMTSGDSLKILGFYFSEIPNMSLHVKMMIKKFYRSLWGLRHLKKARLDPNCMSKTYCSLFRPILEYACNVYGPMINETQKKTIEKCQEKALKIIFGFDYTYDDLLKKSGLKTLENRRDDLFKKFSLKMAKSQRFSTKWLPRMERSERPNTRASKEYIEFYARTSRLYHSPIFKMRRVLNSM